VSERLDVSGPSAPPRANGELVFEQPWESRVFGLTMALCERGALDWEEFRRLLIEEISAWERQHGRGEPYRYYERWLAALERALQARGLCTPPELEERARDLTARPHGHDHPPVRPRGG
jgi:nitrile hydratase accessory protein